MKKGFILFSFFSFFLAFSFAQKPDTLLFQVYFAPAKYNLEEAAQHDLKMLSLLAADASRCKITITGTTENLGDNTKNKVLCMQRCEMVKQQLLALGLQPTYFSEESTSEEISAEAENDGKNKRENRRVDIWVVRYFDAVKKEKEKVVAPPPPAPKIETEKVEKTTENKVKPEAEEKSLPAPAAKISTPPTEKPLEIVSEIIPANTQSLQEILAELRKDKKQSFKFNAQQNATVTLKSGATLYIPARSFSLNSANQTVELVVEEYTKKSEMILGGLTTISGEKLLETGGMFYIRVFSEGKEIELEKNGNISLSIPNQKQNLQGMETFKGKTNSEGKVIDWHPLNTSDSAGMGVLCLYPLPDSIEKKLKTKSSDYCQACFEFKTDAYVTAKSKAKKEKQLSKIQQQIFQKYNITSCDTLWAKIEMELKLMNFSIEDWAQESEKQMAIRQEAHLQEFMRKTLLMQGFSVPKTDYLLEGLSLGWVNCDRFLNSKRKMTRIMIEPLKMTNQNTAAFVVMQQENVIVPLDAPVPLGSNVYVVGIQKKESEILLSFFAGQADKQQLKWNWKTVTKEELVRTLQELDK